MRIVQILTGVWNGFWTFAFELVVGVLTSGEQHLAAPGPGLFVGVFDKFFEFGFFLGDIVIPGQ